MLKPDSWPLPEVLLIQLYVAQCTCSLAPTHSLSLVSHQTKLMNVNRTTRQTLLVWAVVLLLPDGKILPLTKVSTFGGD